MMDCQQFTIWLDDYLDDGLAPDLRAQAEAHLSDCKHCQNAITKARAVQHALRDMPAPAMPAGFAQRAIRQATRQHDHHRRGFATGFVTALVAGFALVLVVGGLLPETIQPTTPLTEVAISVDQPHTVNLVFNANHAMDDATLSIVLPDNIEVVGFPRPATFAAELAALRQPPSMAIGVLSIHESRTSEGGWSR